MRVNNLKSYCLLLFIILSACALPVPQDSPEIARQSLQAQLATLPGAVVGKDDLRLSYPEANLFAPGSVLPLPGGMAVIDPLIELLLQNRHFRAIGTVRSAGHSEEYDQLLASKRLEILSRIFLNRGLTEEQLLLSTAAGTGAPFELQFQPANSANSAGEKR